MIKGVHEVHEAKTVVAVRIQMSVKEPKWNWMSSC